MGVLELLERLHDLIGYAGESIISLLDSVTRLPVALYDFIMTLGDGPMFGYGVVITLALGGLILKIVVNIL